MISGTGIIKAVRCPPHSAGRTGAGSRRGWVCCTLLFSFTRPLPSGKNIPPGVLSASQTINKCRDRYIPGRLTPIHHHHWAK